MSAALAATMLAIGVAVGAAIGPAPSPSQASSSLPVLLGSLARIAATKALQSTTVAVAPAPVTAQATPRRRRRRRRTHASASAEEASSAAATAPPSPETPTHTPAAPKPTTKTSAPPAPITHVWLIELAGSSFAAAAAAPTAAPYIDTQAVPAGTLLSGWSGLDAGAFSNETALLGGAAPQLLDTIVQPPCPEAPAGTSCAAEPGTLSAADEFLKATVPTITSSAAFRESGLIVITFASVGSATATGLPAGTANATLTATPPAGVLLISPFASLRARSAVPFNPTSPKQSLTQLLRR